MGSGRGDTQAAAASTHAAADPDGPEKGTAALPVRQGAPAAKGSAGGVYFGFRPPMAIGPTSFYNAGPETKTASAGV